MWELLQQESQNPEFWVSVAFCLAFGSLIRPVIRKAKSWGQTQAELVQKELDNASSLRQEAEDLYAEYELRTKNIERERADILREAEQEVVQIQQEADDKLSQKLALKKKDAQIRIHSIEENACQNLSHILLDKVMSQTKEIVSQQSIRQSEKEMDSAIDRIFTILEEKKSV